MSERQEDVIKIMAAYRDAEKALREVGTLLRTTYAGQYMWSAKHKTAISGLCVCISALCDDVPHYESDLPNVQNHWTVKRANGFAASVNFAAFNWYM